MDIPSGDTRPARFPQKDVEQPPASPNLQLSEELYRLLIETMNDGLVVIDHQLHFAYVNQKFCDLLGYTWDELANQPMASFLDATNQAIFEQQVAQRPQGLKSTYELHWNTKHGTPIITLVSGSPIHRNGEFAGSFGVITDITERKRAEEERAAHLRFFEGLDRVNRTMQAETDLDQMMRDVLDVLLSIFDCDRAWLVYPCDPDAPTWQVPMERTRPEYPGVLPIAVEFPLDPVGAAVYRILRDSPRPVQFHAAAKHPVPMEMMQGFTVQSFIAMAFYPKIGKAWSFGLHQCSYPRIWTPDEERLFETIGNRLSDTLSSLLTYRNLLEREQHSQSLLRLSKGLEAAQTYNDVINTARDEIRTILGYQNLWVYLLTEDKQFCHLLLAEGHIAEKITTTKDIATLTIKGDPMLEAIAERHEIIVVEDARTDPRTNKEIVTQLGNRTIVNVPIILLDQHLGSVGTGTFGDEGVRVPTESEKEYLTAMASHLAVAIQRIHLLMQRKQAEEERAAHLRYFEGMDQVNRAIQGTNDLDQMLRDVLNTVLVIFDCDRAWLVYPCDPQATSLQVKVEQTRPEYPGASAIGVDIPITAKNVDTLHRLLDSPAPLTFGPHGDLPVPEEVATDFGVQSYIGMVVYPKTGQPWEFGLHQCSYPRIWNDEEKRLFEAVGRRLSDALTSLLAYHNLQKSEANLRQSNNLLQTIIEAAPTAIIGIDLDGNVQLVWNTAAEKMLGWTAAEAMGNLLPSVQRENQEQFKAFRDRIRRGESLNGVEVTRQKRDGTPIDYSIYASPLYDANGLLMGNIAVLVDITERKRQEKALMESETRYRSIVTAMTEGIVLQDQNGAILTCNAAAESMLGLMANQMLGQGSVDLDYRTIYEDGSHFPGDEHPAMVTLRTGIAQRNVIMGIHKANGDLTWISINSEPLTHPNQTLPYAVITSFADITERKRVQSINQARLRLLEFVGTHSMDELLTATLDEIEKLTGSTIGFYHFLQPDQKTLSLQNWSTNTLKTLCTAEGKGSHYPVDQAGVWVDCVYQRRPVIHNDYASLPHRKGLPEGHAPVIRQAVVPIFRGNLIEAIIGVGNKATPYNDNDIEIISQLGDLSWDITERKRAEEALQKQYSTLRGIMENANALIFSVDRDYQYTSFNQAHAATMQILYGVEIEIGQSLLGYMNVPEDREIAKNNLDRALAGERHIEDSYSGEELRSRRYFQVSHSPIQTEAGAIVGVVVLAQDITERKEMERKLEESEKRLRLTLEATQIGVWDWNIECDEWYASPVYYTMLGYEPKAGPANRTEWLGRVHPEDLAEVGDKIENVLTRQFKDYEYEARMRDADGTYHWQYVKGFGIERDANGKVTRMLGIRMDITERKRAAEALRQSEQQFRLLAENSTDMITRHSPDGTYLYASPACTSLLGYHPDDLIGHSAYEFFHPDDVPAVSTSHATILTEPAIYTVQYRIRHKDGHYVWFETTSKTILDKQTHTITEIQAASRDISERKRMEQALALREQESRTLLENIPDLIVRYDTGLRRTYVNPAWEKSSGLMSEEVVNTPPSELLVPQPLVVEYLVKLQNVLKTGRHETAEFTWVNTRGEELTLNYIIVPEYDPNGQIVSILSVGHDITERKRAEITLQHYSQRLSILHQIDRHILKAQSPHDIANTVLEQLIHLIPCEWAGILLHDTTATEARMYALQHLPDTSFPIEKKYAVLSNEAMLQLHLGHSITIPDLHTAPGPHAELNQQLMAEGLRAKLMTPLIMQDQLIGVLILASHQMGYFTEDHQQVAEEIAAQLAIAFYQANLNDQIAQHTVELERRVRERTTELEHVNRELEAFSYSVSHDLRAPLRAIEGFAEIIARRHRDTLNEEGQRYFDNIVQASEQMNQLIGDLLTYARLGRQRQGLLRLVTLDPILAEVQTNLAPLVAEKGGQINIPTHLPAVRGDKTLLKQIFTNLLENALVYHRPDVPPVVSVTCTPEDHAVLMVVEDNGIGIPPEFREKVFGIFQRLHSQEQYPGTGIGLAIVRKTVEMLGGEVWIEDAAVQGTRFCIKLLTEPEKDR